jgi:hypothetical protein
VKRGYQLFFFHRLDPHQQRLDLHLRAGLCV